MTTTTSLADSIATEDQIFVIPDRPTRHKSSKLSMVVFVVACVAAYGVGMWLMWGSMLDADIRNSIKNYYLGDSMSYMSIARNVQAGHSAYVEPFTATGSSIYPSGYYWLLGMFAKTFNTSIWAAWNVVGVFATLSLMVAVGAWGRWASRSKWGWMLGPVPLVIGTLQWYSTGSYYKAYPNASVIWAPQQVLFSPSAETPGLLLSALALLSIVKMLNSEKNAYRWALASGALIGLALNVHTYCAIFGVTAIAATLLVSQLLDNKLSRRDATIVIAIAAAATGVLMLDVASGLSALAIVLAAVLAPIFVVSKWRKAVGVNALITFGTAAIVALPLLVRIAAQITDKNSFYYLRQDWAIQVNSVLPAGDMAWQGFPLLLSAVIAIAYAVTHRRDKHDRVWASALIGVAATSLLLVFNASWGMKQEPYRFYPYALLFIGLTALPLIFRNTRMATWGLPRVAMAIAIALTIPTAWFFHNQTGSTLTVPGAETADYNNVAGALPKSGLALIDTCIPQLAFKVTTGAETTFFNKGLAIPANFDALQTVATQQINGTLPSTQELQAAGVTSFVTNTYCKSATQQQLADRFGAPIATIPLTNPDLCGMPADARYEVYSTVGAKSAPAVKYEAWTPADRFVSPANGGTCTKLWS